jgi:DNA-binding LytR/AlgR family response regulator
VNLSRVRRFDASRAGGGCLVLRDGTEVRVSRRQRAEVRRRLADLAG